MNRKEDRKKDRKEYRKEDRKEDRQGSEKRTEKCERSFWGFPNKKEDIKTLKTGLRGLFSSISI